MGNATGTRHYRYGTLEAMQSPRMRFTFYAIERIEQGAHRGGAQDEDFDPAILPFDVGNEVFIEDVGPFIPEDEFDIYKDGMGSYVHARLEGLRYALVHRFPEYETEDGKRLISQTELVERSRRKVLETAACLRLIRPTVQHLHKLEGRIGDDRMFAQVALDTPREFVFTPLNQRNFGFRTKDGYTLRRLVPLFHDAMAGQFWKFRMAVHMHESGCFQHEDWKPKFFLWTASLEALYTSYANQGSIVASERIKALLGADTPIYPAGDLASIYPDPNLTVGDVVGEIYCLRNHIAHGDKVPDSYFLREGRPSSVYGDGAISRIDMLLEAISFIIRHSLIRIMADGLIDHFQNNDTADHYFGPELTKRGLRDAKIKMPNCPA